MIAEPDIAGWIHNHLARQGEVLVARPADALGPTIDLLTRLPLRCCTLVEPA